MQVRQILKSLIYKGLRLLSNLLPILKIGGSNPFERAKKFLVSSRRGISFLRRDSKDERDRATVRWTVATASDQAPAGARVEPRCLHQKTAALVRELDLGIIENNDNFLTTSSSGINKKATRLTS